MDTTTALQPDRRLRLTAALDDEHTSLRPGARGTITTVTTLTTWTQIGVAWDDGSRLSLLLPDDRGRFSMRHPALAPWEWPDRDPGGYHGITADDLGCDDCGTACGTYLRDADDGSRIVADWADYAVAADGTALCADCADGWGVA